MICTVIVTLELGLYQAPSLAVTDLSSTQLLHTVNLHKVANVLIKNHSTLPKLSSLLHATTPLSQLRLILIFYMSRTDSNKGWAIDNYLGDSQCLLIVLLIIGITDHYPIPC